MRLVYVVPTFHNPTGVTMPEEQRRELVRFATELDVRVVEDLTPDATLGVGVPPPIAAFDREGDRVITVGSLSKIAWGGLRIGWVRASRPDIDRLVAAKIVADHSSSLITQAIAARVLDEVEAIAAQTMRVGRRAATGRDRAPSLRASRTGSGRCRRAASPCGSACPTPTRRRSAGSPPSMASSFGPGPLASPDGGYRDHIRIAYGTSPDSSSKGVERLATAWAAYAPAARHPRSSLAISV